MKKYFSLFAKGFGMGAANVVPGVSGGTIALITGIFETLIDSIKSFNLQALQLLFSGKIKDFFKHINGKFLLAVFTGVAISIITIARVFGYMLEFYPIYIMSFFFGLILASVYYVGRTIENWRLSVILSFIIGTAIAISLSLLNPARENDSILYLLLCGVVATCSMILPGLSGSFVLILMGNYQLVMIDAVNDLNFKILIPVVMGAVIGLLLFSNILSYLYKKFRNHTISTLTGFILGSLGTIWPWKTEIPAVNENGSVLVKDGEAVTEGYDWFIPAEFNSEVLLAIVFIIIGIAVIWATEHLASRKTNQEN